MHEMQVESIFTCFCFGNNLRTRWDYLHGKKVVSLGKVEVHGELLLRRSFSFFGKLCNAYTMMVSEAASCKKMFHSKYTCWY